MVISLMMVLKNLLKGDLNVKMMRPIPRDTNLIAEGKVINISKSLGVSDGILKSEDGKLYATSTATCLIINNKG